MLQEILDIPPEVKPANAETIGKLEKITTEEFRDKCVNAIYSACEYNRIFNKDSIPYYCQKGVLPPTNPQDASGTFN